MLQRTRARRIGEHLLFWLVYWVFTSFSAGLYDFDFTTVALYSLSNLPLTILTTYVFVYALLPLYSKGKLILFILFTALLMMAALLLKRVSVQHIQFPLFYANTDWTFTFFDWYRIVGNLLQICATIALVSAIKIYRDWRITQDRLERIQTEKRNLELNYLKAQTSPHFLFNTLNSIYYEVVNKAETAPDSVIRLSELLRHVLYECSENFIQIEKEIELINNYIELQKRRYKNRLVVHFHHEGDTSKLCPPLIGFSLVENAFKHGMTEQIGECIIDIDLRIDATHYSLTIKNPVTQQHVIAESIDRPKGLGLQNVNRQLSLIYQDDYILTNSIEDGTYICSLKLPLIAK